MIPAQKQEKRHSMSETQWRRRPHEEGRRAAFADFLLQGEIEATAYFDSNSAPPIEILSDPCKAIEPVKDNLIGVHENVLCGRGLFHAIVNLAPLQQVLQFSRMSFI
jgi:hypothetical protein